MNHTLMLFTSLLMATNAASSIAADATFGIGKPVEKTPTFTTAKEAPQRYIVKFKSQQSANRYVVTSDTLPTLSPTQKRTLIESHKGKFVRALPHQNSMVSMLNKQQKSQLENNADVEFIEPDHLRTLQSVSSTEQTPWGIQSIKANEVSDINSGSITVCVADTGLDVTHEDFQQNQFSGEIVNTLNGEINLGVWSEDNYGHGTHMVGTIAAIGHNDIGSLGILPSGQVNIHAVKIVDNPANWAVYSSDIVQAVTACNNAGAKIINLSIAGRNYSQTERLALDEAYRNGSLIIAASGNFGNSSKFYPASYASVVSVGAVDKNSQPWIYTQKNAAIELVAPGVEVRSTLPNNRYASWDGTSSAAAHVSGVAALVASEHPSCSMRQVRHALQLTATDLGAANRDDTFGYGLVNAKAASDALTQQGCDAFTYGDAPYRSCREIKDADADYGSGMYLIDVDGPQYSYPAHPAYCEMNLLNGGWTLVSYHHDNNTFIESNTVEWRKEGTMNDYQWARIRDNMTTGMMFWDDTNRVTYINKEKLESARCLAIQDVHSLLRSSHTHAALWHDEILGCDVLGQDYSLIFHQAGGFGVSMYNHSDTPYDIWGYGSYSASWAISSAQGYFVK